MNTQEYSWGYYRNIHPGILMIYTWCRVQEYTLIHLVIYTWRRVQEYTLNIHQCCMSILQRYYSFLILRNIHENALHLRLPLFGLSPSRCIMGIYIREYSWYMHGVITELLLLVNTQKCSWEIRGYGTTQLRCLGLPWNRESWHYTTVLSWPAVESGKLALHNRTVMACWSRVTFTHDHKSLKIKGIHWWHHGICGAIRECGHRCLVFRGRDQRENTENLVAHVSDTGLTTCDYPTDALECPDLDLNPVFVVLLYPLLLKISQCILIQ